MFLSVKPGPVLFNTKAIICWMDGNKWIQINCAFYCLGEAHLIVACHARQIDPKKKNCTQITIFIFQITGIGWTLSETNGLVLTMRLRTVLLSKHFYELFSSREEYTFTGTYSASI